MSDGFALQRRNETLKFEEIEEIAGLELTCRLDIPLSTFLDLQDNLAGSEEGVSSGTLRDAFTIFSESILVDWNLQGEDGKRIKPDKAGFFTVPPSIASKIMAEYFAVVSDVPDPLDQESKNGSP